ncbi:hypothetical protein [Salininema proteolyticum]|uniref:Uncharacterized protein n=1 Tax=Salininema proteolyticum TaxID=1607685 RepID=A0ABV8U058_9ACTN
MTEVLVALISGLSAVSAAGVGLLTKRLKQVDHQVSNNHASNLRDDVDQISHGIAQLLARHERHEIELQGIRTVLATDASRLVDLDARLAHIEAPRKEASGTGDATRDEGAT